MSALTFADCTAPGITRRACGKGWIFLDPQGQRIAEQAEIERLKAIALPPACTDCWYSLDPNAHILATGIDARGRKQYRYHPEYRERQEALKFDSLREFGAALPAIRRRVEADVAQHRINRERALACVVRLLDSTALRIGNECYAKANRTFGATTLRRRHLRLEGKTIRLRFKAKSGKQRELALTDRNLMRFIRQVQDLPGQHLFQFLDESGDPAPVSSCDVNAYLSEAAGTHFTAKHFRTWAASVTAFEAIVTDREPPTIKSIAGMVADVLANTPAIARKSYIHPEVFALVSDEDARSAWCSKRLPRKTRWLLPAERGFLTYLQASESA
ncbi:DNA topoisomerase IB [Novosphingobium sp. KN65.2]|nr:DNA topoisomerase IB [Novosphingobium sp. KN65.2]CDO38678.1 conserved hypothetical protein [Novosphingobium sp. KN65.2]